MFYRSLQTSTAAAVAFLLALSSVPASAQDKLSKDEKRWMEEEVAALITEKEKEIFQDIEKKDRKLFQELFWKRRDFNPMTPENEFKDEYEARVAAADRNFKVRGRKGSTSDMGQIFLLLGAPSDVEQNQRGGGGTPETPSMPRPSGGDPGGEESPAFGNLDPGEQSGAQLVTWMYEPNPQLGIPDGLNVQFRAQSGFGYRLVQSDELKETIERVKSRFVTNPTIDYARNEEGRLLEPRADVDPNSPAKQILQTLRDTQTPSADVPFEAELAYFQGAEDAVYIPMLFEIDPAPLTWSGEQAQATVFGVVENAEGNPIYQFEELADITKRSDRAVFELPILLKPGDYKLYLGVRDAESGATGTQILPVQVPSFSGDGLKLSSVILFTAGNKTTEHMGQPGKAFLIGGYHWVPKLDKTYQKSDQLSGVFNAYGYGLDGQGNPNLTAQYVFYKDDTPRGQTKDEPFISASETMAITVFDIPLATFEPGNYRLEIKVTDHVKNEVVTEYIEFQLADGQASQ